MKLRRLHPTRLRAAWWTYRALRDVRRQLRSRDVRTVALSEPPALPPYARHTISAVLRRERATCLEESLVLQKWLAAAGSPIDVVIGVSPTADLLDAHAWLDGDPSGDEYEELMRLAAR